MSYNPYQPPGTYAPVQQPVHYPPSADPTPSQIWHRHKPHLKIMIFALVGLIFFALSLGLPWQTAWVQGEDYVVSSDLTKIEVKGGGSSMSMELSSDSFKDYSEFKALSYGTFIIILVALILAGLIIFFTFLSMKSGVRPKWGTLFCQIVFILVLLAIIMYGAGYQASLTAGCHRICSSCSCGDTSKFIGTKQYGSDHTEYFSPGAGWFMALVGGILILLAFLQLKKLPDQPRSAALGPAYSHAYSPYQNQDLYGPHSQGPQVYRPPPGGF